MTQAGKGAFKKTAVTKLIARTKMLAKKSAKGSLRGSKVKSVQVNVGSKKVNKKYVKKCKEVFAKKVCGKKTKIGL